MRSKYNKLACNDLFGLITFFLCFQGSIFFSILKKPHNDQLWYAWIYLLGSYEQVSEKWWPMKQEYIYPYYVIITVFALMFGLTVHVLCFKSILLVKSPEAIHVSHQTSIGWKIQKRALTSVWIQVFLSKILNFIGPLGWMIS